MKKRILSVFLSVVLIAGIYPISSLAADNEDYVKQIVSAMGIMNGDTSGDLRLYDNITRAEFSKMVVAASTNAANVPERSYVSPFSDVSYQLWSAPYVKIASDMQIMKGYSDGYFRPNNPILYEEALTAVLRLIGYGDSDFGSSYPYGQIALADKLGLLSGLTGGQGRSIIRKDAMYLFYNALSAKPSGNYDTYAQTIGYSVSNGQIDLNSVMSKNLSECHVVKSHDWYNQIGINISGTTFYKDGKKIEHGEIATYDVIYYSKTGKTAWVYSDKVTGTYQAASPDRNSPTSITVAGNSYVLENSSVRYLFGTGGGFSFGDGVTLLLGRNSQVVDAISPELVSNRFVGIAIASGTKDYEGSSGITHTSYYLTVLDLEGKPFELQLGYNPMGMVGKPVSVVFSGGAYTVNQISQGGGLSGTLDAQRGTFAGYSLSSNLRILEVDKKNGYAVLYPQRLDGVYFPSGSILYFELNSKNEVTALVIKEEKIGGISGDTYLYGTVTSVSAVSENAMQSASYMIGSSIYSQSHGSGIDISRGPAMFSKDGEKIVFEKKLDLILNKIVSISANVATDILGNTYKLSDSVLIYSLSLDSYVLSSLSLAEQRPEDIIGLYTDKAEAKGGRIRVIIVR